jgi:predicted porin
MNKKILSLAVAAAMAAPLAAQADVTVYGDINMDVSSVNTHTASDYYTWPVGKFFANPSMNCGAFGILTRGSFPCRSIPGSRGNIYMSDNAWELNSNNSRIGFKGSEDLGNGLSAIWGIELQVDVAGDGSLGINHNNVNTDPHGAPVPGNDIGTRNMFLGLSSAQFGTVVAGKHDTPYKIMFNSYDKFAETMADDDQLMKGATPNRALIGEFNG